MKHPIIEARRDFLRRSLGSSLLITSGAAGLLPGLVHGLGKIPEELIPGKSIYDMRGQVLVDGQRANEDTYISPNSLVQTGSSSYVVFVIGFDAHILRENSRVQFRGENDIEESLKLATGKLLSVFGARTGGRTHTVETSTATIGIRGTGLYIESEDDVSYACTCYGRVDIASNSDPSSQETVVSVHHDSPRYIARDGNAGTLISAAPMKNHTDEELLLIEQLVGRKPPFTGVDSYTAPRRGY